uniref:Protein transport protein sec16 n=1 Tax=Sinocyclocheilus grahami TaxID=75366 RepID=A0A672RM32_SINGR
MPYIAQLPNPAPSFSSSSSHPPSTGPTPPVQSQAPFQYQPTPPLPSHWVPDQGSRPPSVQNYFQPTSDLPSQPFQAQAPPPVPSPHTAPPVAQSQNQGQSAQPNVTGPAATQQQNSHFLAQNYFSQSVGPSEPWFNQNPQDPSQRACPVSYSEVPSDSGTLSMFFRGNDVENKETLSGEGRVNGIHHPFHSTTDFLILGGSKMIMNNFSVSFSNFFPFSAPPRPLTPEKFSVPHRCARFGPAGQLILVQPNLPSAGQPTLVEIHSMETILQDSPEQSEMRSFPGPLVKEETHKVDVIKFAQNKAQECLRNDDLIDKDSAYLIWEFIVLLCRQNGTVVGTDIADLLLKEHRSVWLPGKSPNEANLIDFNNEAIERAEEEEAGPISLLSDTFMGVPENVGKETERFRELLLFGRKKDALESAMKNGLWGHALLLASKMDNRTHARVMTSLPINDPLQTVYQLMSGRMPAAATCCGDEKWGDWRPHLAMVLSNLTHTLDLDTRTISTMGDTLASKGLVDAAHFCYLMAQVGFGVYTKKSTKMVLIGSNHSLQFLKFCSSEAIQRTESYEYAQSLCSQPLSLPNFQVFKFIYACRLAEAGLCAQAFHYCEVISRTLLSLPEYYSAVFISQLIQMSLRLRFFDPQMKERPEQELFIEPDWLLHLRQLDGQIKVCVRFLLSINHHASGACYLSAFSSHYSSGWGGPSAAGPVSG